MKKICVICGKEFEAKYKNRMYCSQKCCNKKMIEYRKQEAEGVEKSWKKEKSCKICGKPFVPRIANQLCCSAECSNINARSISRKNEKINREKEEKRVLEEARIKKRKERTLKPLSISEINKRARKEHLTYGQYCAKYGL